ncbi:hypothetical protein [Cytobacillus horneckiae]|uniref:Uncharacterized protein n=1 Tax=Cytobacillus horneckiae TaxID=549687 RepID=A0A2N0ZAN8_9BACI|nr:hypothetical protein [Cytobacillus horneckiae]MEC1157584.1 hypothetical protein [Cytobacillus horneckiae]PKG26563.1 hypothetical protein CWS20_23345 [Cytobacillus horneckiae]
MRESQKVDLCIITIFIIALLFIASPVAAHGFENHEKNNLLLWIIGFLIVLSSAITIGAWTKTIYSGFMKQEYQVPSRILCKLAGFPLELPIY